MSGTFPNTLVIGAGKSGTTSLCDDLALHPDVYLYHSKETNFFSFNYSRGEDWFRSLFTPDGQKIVLDGSSDYTVRGRTLEIMQRIHGLLPDARLIYMVRHPVERIESHYVQELANGRRPISFGAALRDWHLVDGSLYEKNIEIVERLFDPSNVHTIFLDDYRQDKTSVLKALFAFLGLTECEACYQPRAALNTRGDKALDSSLLKLARRLPAFYRLKGMIPGSMKQGLKAAVNSKLEVGIDWTAEDRAETLAMLRPDTERFLVRNGKPRDFWKLDHVPA